MIAAARDLYHILRYETGWKILYKSGTHQPFNELKCEARAVGGRMAAP